MFIGLVLVFPIGILLALSFAYRWTWPAILPSEWHLRLWIDVLADGNGIGTAVIYSALMALGVGTLATSMAFPASRQLAMHRQRGMLLLLMHLPYAISPAVLGTGLLYCFLKFGLSGHVTGVMLAQLIFAYAYAVIFLTGFWNDRILAFSMLAESLGAKPFQVWTRVLLPLASPLLLICFFQTFSISWFDYALAAFIGAGTVSTLPVKLLEYFNSGDLRLACVCAILLLTPPLFGTLVQRKLALLFVPQPYEIVDE